ncbi:MAG: tRNA (N6-isopentenyl adenosine(37)-C2)-methylthiotransferase MiaB [Holosporales bacterium]|jgi:tRNA-2-methylthio-N6-dimethylallyladenosine synthase|nr:tRNA (N6-isopentenyl adenosine(37)-C2)-methylthiotransferase MiaB [Holosporales bacterium]
MHKFHIVVYGCQMNVHDSRRISDTMLEAGFVRTYEATAADILIFYTCNIREKAAHKVFSDIGLLKTKRTRIIAVGGCVAQAEQSGIFKNRDVNIVFGPHVYHKLPEYIKSIANGETDRILDVATEQSTKFNCLPVRKNVSCSEFVTIQEGCDNFCTYCVVPHTRGREFSRPALDVIREVKELVASGAKEITLVGQNVNSYHGEAPYITVGHPRGTWRLERLIMEIADLDGVRRLRYVTSHPRDFTRELMETHAKVPVLAPFVHIPVQSGNNRILKIMNRGHNVSEYLDKLKMFLDICPGVQFSSDFIVGFPTEMDSEFGDTLKLVDEVKYTTSYSFKYSRRRGTPADRMHGQVPEETKEVRLATLQQILLRDQIAHNNSLVGKINEVLFEKRGRYSNQYIGKNAYMQSVVVESQENLVGIFANVLIESASTNSVSGKIV